MEAAASDGLCYVFLWVSDAGRVYTESVELTFFQLWMEDIRRSSHAVQGGLPIEDRRKGQLQRMSPRDWLRTPHGGCQ